ncbi:hypothetical protein VNO77_02183 [Canavalia gladiata]|uniref:Uncharacterized protein n=1 Tax=Canavalia gladiata TaxID=3824 RepID=A0AAN9R5V2_CANGL
MILVVSNTIANTKFQRYSNAISDIRYHHSAYTYPNIISATALASESRPLKSYTPLLCMQPKQQYSFIFTLITTFYISSLN